MLTLLQDPKLKALVARMPALANITGIQLLEGGLTNKNYRISTRGPSYVLRVSEGEPNQLGINRLHEKINTQRSYEAGIGPAVVHAIVEEGVLLINWIDATTLHPANLHGNTALLKRMASALRRLHNGPTFEGHFHFPSIRKKYLETVIAKGYYLPAGYLETAPKILALEAALAATPEPLVSCNNDLLAENFLDDGERIWIIDYEYAGLNEASFEIGNLAGESNLSLHDITTLCEAYWTTGVDLKVARALAWSMIARYGWTLWASLQEAVSSIPFNFRAWGMAKWNTVLPELMGNDYDRILQTLKQQTV